MTAMIERWRQQFAYVLIDTPPVLPVTDAVVLSPNADAVIVVVRFGVTNQQSVHRTIRALRDVQANRVGVLVNAMDVHSPDYYHYSGSYGYDGYHEGDVGEFHLLVPPSSEPNPKGESA
jgi:Mrp family chromosome partitioning ATPase